MFYDELTLQLRSRGAGEIVRSTNDKTTQFNFDGKRWVCRGPQCKTMATELSDGYEMPYCLALYCDVIFAS